MLLKDLIAKRERLVAVGPTATVRDVVEVMRSANVGCVAVLETNRLVGILTERDLVRRVLAVSASLDQTVVADVMTPDVVVASAEDSIGTAARLMREHHIRHLPVVDKNETLLAVISIRDLLREEIQTMRDYIGQTEG